MLRRITGSRKLAALLLHNNIIHGLTLCVSLWLMSGSVFALIYPPPAPGKAAHSPTITDVIVTVSSTGCNPSSVTHTAGQITLRVANQTEKAELAVQLYASKGELLREVNINGATEWSETFDLQAGSYTLIADHNSDWVFHLTVQ